MFRKHWLGRITSTGMGWNLRKGPDSAYLVHFTVSITVAPEAHCGRAVDIEMTPQDAVAFADSVMRAATQAHTQNRRNHV
jgi:hypothetical protein